MQLTDEARETTEKEGKKLKGFGARMRDAFDILLRSTGKQDEHGLELDNERGFLEEEITFDDLGKEQEERKKREAMRQANRMQKQGQRISMLKGRKAAKERDASDSLINEKGDYKKDKSPELKEETKQIRENNLKAEMAGQNVENKPQQQLEVTPEKTPVLKEGQVIQQSAIVRSEALESMEQKNIPVGKNDAQAMEFLVGKDNMKNLDRSGDVAAAVQQDASSPVKGVMGAVKDLLTAVLPTQLPDVRDGKDKGGPAL